MDNLALSCTLCNRRKGSDITSVDPGTAKSFLSSIREPSDGRIISKWTVSASLVRRQRGERRSISSDSTCSSDLSSGPSGLAPGVSRPRGALLHGPEQNADLPVSVVESPSAVRIGHPERGHLVEYLAPNAVFNSLPRQRSSPHLGPDERLVTIDRVLHHASLGVARELVPFTSAMFFDCANMAISLLHGGVRTLTERRVSLRRNHHARPSSRTVCFDGFVDRFLCRMHCPPPTTIEVLESVLAKRVLALRRELVTPSVRTQQCCRSCAKRRCATCAMRAALAVCGRFQHESSSPCYRSSGGLLAAFGIRSFLRSSLERRHNVE